MGDDFPLQAGDTLSTAQLSLCAGGLVRTWTEDGPPRLWSIPDGERLRSAQGTGAIARTLHEPGRLREVALLSAETATMFIARRPQPDGTGGTQFEGYPFPLASPSAPGDSTLEDVLAVLTQAVRYCVSNHEFLVVETGGGDAPPEPYCLFALLPQDDPVTSVIETVPPPRQSTIWQPHIVEGEPGATLTAAANDETIGVAPRIMLDAIATWGLTPWDLVLTFGNYG